jgi:hypothetical protein
MWVILTFLTFIMVLQDDIVQILMTIIHWFKHKNTLAFISCKSLIMII